EKWNQWKDAGASVVRVGVVDLDGVIRGKTVSLDKCKSMLQDGFGFCNVVFGWDVEDKVYEKSLYTGWDFGYPDSRVTLDVNTARTIPWLHNMPFLLGDFSTDEQVGEICPRSLLKR